MKKERVVNLKGLLNKSVVETKADSKKVEKVQKKLRKPEKSDKKKKKFESSKKIFDRGAKKQEKSLKAEPLKKLEKKGGLLKKVVKKDIKKKKKSHLIFPVLFKRKPKIKLIKRIRKYDIGVRGGIEKSGISRLKRKQAIESKKQINMKNVVLTILIALLILFIVFVASVLLYSYYESPLRQLGVGADIQNATVSLDGQRAYIRLAGGSNLESIIKIKFIFTDSGGNEYSYETTEGIEEIEVPFKRSFLDWILRKPAFAGVYDYEISAEEVGIENFDNIEEVSVVFEYEGKGEILETSPLDTKEPVSEKPVVSGGGGGGGGGSAGGGGGTAPAPCVPSKTCSDYSGECGIGLSDGCENVLDCSANCESGARCYTEEGVKYICVDNSIACVDSDGGKSFYEKGDVIIGSLVSQDFCSDSSVIEYYCYYNGTGFESRNVSYACDFGCKNGSCSSAGCNVSADCDDGISCTLDSCIGDFCSYTGNDTFCDDRLYCNGQESCDAALDCQAGVAPSIDDNVNCTIDSCDEINDTITHIPDNSLCLEGLWCNGQETCDVVLGCQAGIAPDCDDKISCAVDSCDEGKNLTDNLGTCEHDTEGCDCLINADCDDGNSCTDDTCNATLQCENIANDGNSCEDDSLCTINDSCSSGSCVGTSVVIDDGIKCTSDSCDPSTGDISHIPDDSSCDDDLYCNGQETCDVVLGCQAGIAPDCDDSISCTVDSCDEDIGLCLHLADDELCDDENECTNDGCVLGIGCQSSNLPLGSVCSEGICDGNGNCVSFPADYVSWLRFDTLSAGVTSDETERNDARLVGDAIIVNNGGKGSVLSLDDFSDYAFVEFFQGSNPSQGTYTFWIYYTDPDNNEGFLTSNSENPRIINSNGNMRFRVDKQGGGNGLQIDCNNVVSDRWVFYAFTYNNTRGIIYRDGIFCSQDTTVNLPYALTSDFYIGSNTAGDDAASLGSFMDDVMFYDRALTGAEILQIYNAQSPVSTLPELNILGRIVEFVKGLFGLD